MKFGVFKGNQSEDPHEKMAQDLLSIVKERYSDEFTQDDALETYALKLGLRSQEELQGSQKLHVGRLLAKLSKQHDVFEIDGRYVFPPKDVYH